MIDSYRELLIAFQWWAGEKWVGSSKQWKAFNEEAERLGFEIPSFIREEVRESWSSETYVPEVSQKARTWRREAVVVRGKRQERYRDLKTGRFIKKP